MGQFLEYCKIAYFNLKANKIRALLTMLGIIIGISSVVMIVSLGSGFKKSITKEIDSIAGNYIEVLSYGDFGFEQEDLEAIEERVPYVAGTTAAGATRGTISYNNTKECSALIKYGNENADTYSTYDIIRGRYFTKEESDNAENVMIITKGSARKMFGSTDVIGMNVDLEVYGYIKTYRIIGVRDDSSEEMESFAMHNVNYDMTAEIPLNTLSSQMGFTIHPNDIVIILSNAEHSDEVADRTRILLENRHDCVGENAIIVMNYNSMLSQITSIFTLVTALIMMVAGISLFVGGIGVMNIMLVSVTERTREIGIRKALGARTGSILTQFLVESATISLVGGLIGTIIGLGGAEILCLIISKVAGESIVADFNILFILGIAIFSMSIGVIFGIIPARKAAKYNPIDALRSR